ncbi:Hsp33-like chaperonin [Loigolactobacillus bifermentans DSM 20003]|uniref:33 kDa chaperonin n=2 Tax=Loigolactobacillus bifermentans TaxID=1607 RepID=A0A0R1H4N1_9LACO|nr:Hsp33-like chaperonin [Loigolactobacillus bifermentans DSM 20003]
MEIRYNNKRDQGKRSGEKMSDKLISSLAFDKTVRGFAVDATATVQEAQRRHQATGAGAVALGNVLLGTLLMSAAGLKGDQTLSVKVMGDGPAGLIVADGRSDGTIKGYLQYPQITVPEDPAHQIAVHEAVGTQGTITVTKDLGLKQPYNGQTPLASGDIGADLTYYLAASEQIPASMGLAVHLAADGMVDAAGGFLVEMMPGATDDTATALETQIKALPQLIDWLPEDHTPADLLDAVLGAKQQILATQPVAFQCDCSKERFAKALAGLKPAQLQQMITDDHGAEAVCRFCQTHYQFSEAELKALLPTE